MRHKKRLLKYAALCENNDKINQWECLGLKIDVTEAIIITKKKIQTSQVFFRGSGLLARCF